MWTLKEIIETPATSITCITLKADHTESELWIALVHKKDFNALRYKDIKIDKRGEMLADLL